ncbi:hypothetical protein X741_27365 [Mesorhizobium sp. LNHC229A00]|nr:hypothetical protein X741_27365 [Mesorhizobium sp. LNHC229A00]
MRRDDPFLSNLPCYRSSLINAPQSTITLFDNVSIQPALRSAEPRLGVVVDIALFLRLGRRLVALRHT